MSNHTPGPWEARDWRVVNDYRNSPIKVICDTAHNKATRNDENAANARLIAAAPDLLAVCELASHADALVPLSQYTIDCIRAAIAKAKGGA